MLPGVDFATEFATAFYMQPSVEFATYFGQCMPPCIDFVTAFAIAF